MVAKVAQSADIIKPNATFLSRIKPFRTAVRDPGGAV
jgi:hypothetical protein